MSVDLRVPAYKTLADNLRAQITSGRLRPGERLPTEPQLGRTAGVSRSTVREALRQLASQNLIVTTRGVAGGSFVAHPSPDQISETLGTGVRLLVAGSVVRLEHLVEVREMFDVASAGLAARRRRPEHLAAFAANLAESDATEDTGALFLLHLAFHQIIAEACDNQLLDLISKPLQSVGNAADVAKNFGPEVWRETIDDHRVVAAAIAASDPEAAEEAARAHLRNLRRYLTIRADTLVPRQPTLSQTDAV